MAQGSRKRKLMGDINVVPYIDVMLVLLIIFMVTAPLLMQGVKVDLPKAAAEPLDAELLKNANPLVLSIDRAGKLYLNVGSHPENSLEMCIRDRRCTKRRSPRTSAPSTS